MSNHAIRLDVPADGTKPTASYVSQLDRVSAAFALSAAVTVVFNTLLAWGKDAYPPLNTFMAHLLGHHWTTHGVADVLLFVVLGLVFLNLGVAGRMNPVRLIGTLVGAVVAAGLGLAAWFVLF